LKELCYYEKALYTTEAAEKVLDYLMVISNRLIKRNFNQAIFLYAPCEPILGLFNPFLLRFLWLLDAMVILFG
jgi:hypothetical protein